MAAADVTDVLRQTDLLRSIPDGDLAALPRSSRTRAVRRGQLVCTTGDPGDTLIVVIAGRVKIVVRSADGGELTLAAVGPGETLGEVSVADGGPRSADVETLEDSQLLLLPREHIQDICARFPAAGLALASSVAATLRRLTEATSDLVFLDLPRRVAKVLLSSPATTPESSPRSSRKNSLRIKPQAPGRASTPPCGASKGADGSQ